MVTAVATAVEWICRGEENFKIRHDRIEGRSSFDERFFYFRINYFSLSVSCRVVWLDFSQQKLKIQFVN